MATIAEQLTSLADAKSAIKGAIISRGVSVSDTDPLRTYADKIGQIGETVPETRFGVGIGNLLGTVDADGNYIEPTKKAEINLAGVKSVPPSSFAYEFNSYRYAGLIANDIVNVSSSSFEFACNVPAANASTPAFHAEFGSLEEINNSFAFSKFFGSRPNATACFPKLRKVSGQSVFAEFITTDKTTMTPDTLFPALEEVSGSYVLSNFLKYNESLPMTFTKLKKITGSTSVYSAAFGYFYVNNTVWNFPSATEMTGYIWNGATTVTGEIHFAAANQAAIEACDGYADKWGFAGATIYFDL